MITIPKNLNDDILEYCKVNNITDIDLFMLRCLRQGFTVEKYGATPKSPEKIVEKIVEVPVEKVIERFVEVPIEKNVYITDDTEIGKLTAEIERLQKLNTINHLDMTQTINDYNEKINELTNQLTQLKAELEIEKKKKRDIYGE